MCGLFGVIGTSLTPAERYHFAQLAYLSCFRGTDSTGCAAVGKEKGGKMHVRMHKSVDNPVSFVESAGFHDKILAHNPFLLMGHARAATVGDVKPQNAHPFRYKHIIGAHNGTIPKLGSKTRTDSEELYTLIADNGLDILKELDGAYALTYLDTESKTINFIRNSQRPLFFMRGGANIILYASERRMLLYMGDLLNWSHTIPITMFETDKRYWIEFGSTVIHSESLKDERPFVSAIKPPVIANPRMSPALQVGLGYPYSSVETSVKTVEVKEPPTVKDQADRLISSKYVWKGFRDEEMTVDEYKERLAIGCCNCEKVCTPAQKTFFVDRNDYLCPECQKDGTIMSMFGYVGNLARLAKR